MLKNYFKIAVRNIRKNKGFSLLNILGLALGLSCALLILLWIQDETSYNTFHKKYDNLYQVMENQSYDQKIYTFASTPGLLAQAMKTDIPAVKHAARMGWGERWLFTTKENPVYENGNYVDPDFFEMFSFDFIRGNSKTALPNENSIVITERMAEKFFGEENPVGNYLTVNNTSRFMVTGVISDPPANSSMQFSWLVSFRIFEKNNEWWKAWTNNGMLTYVELSGPVDLPEFNRKFKTFIKDKNNDANAEPLLHPMKDWRLRSNFEEGKQAGGRIEYVRLFSVIAILLIVIACINFMNLATARSEQRSKEIGVRKVMGAQRSSLVTQFLGESVVMAFFSMLIACVLVMLFLPFFNELVSKKLSIGFDRPVQWLIFAGIALLCGIISGSYPSIYLSAFKPVSIFRKSNPAQNSGASLVRKSLVVTQFVVSIALIISTVVIYKQIDHVKKRQLGYNKNNLLYVSQTGKMNEKFEVIRQDLLATGVVSHVGACSQNVLQINNNTGGINWEGKDRSKDVLITTDCVSSDYVNTIGMKLVAGRHFYEDVSRDSFNVIINETMAKILGKKDPLGTRLFSNDNELVVVGVVKDFVFNNMYAKPDPVIFYCAPRYTTYCYFRIQENADMEKALAKIEAVFRKDNPGYPFEYSFLDADFDKQFKSEMLIGKLSRLFAMITIVVSCLGLFGLAAYTAERRTKEIGIRKVLGATVTNLVSLLSKDFLKLVLIAIVLASPLAWYLMRVWLQDYPYRIEIRWWIFAGAGLLALLIALITVSFQAIKAALSNPVKNLRTE